jgi:hypothetical protein
MIWFQTGSGARSPPALVLPMTLVCMGTVLAETSGPVADRGALQATLSTGRPAKK